MNPSSVPLFQTPGSDRIKSSPVLHFLFFLKIPFDLTNVLTLHVDLKVPESGLTLCFFLCCRYHPPAFLLPTMNW